MMILFSSAVESPVEVTASISTAVCGTMPAVLMSDEVVTFTGGPERVGFKAPPVLKRL